MQDIIKPIDRALLKAELTGDKKLRRTNKSNNEIFFIELIGEIEKVGSC